MNNSSVPRQVSAGLKARIIFNNPRAWIGLVFVAMGLIFTAIFGSMSDMNFSNPLDQSPSIALGLITSINETSASENKKTIMEYRFSYKVDDKRYKGSSYYPGYSRFNDGELVTVEYDKNNPSFARIQGFRMAPFNGEMVLIFLLFPLVGLILLISAVMKGRANIALVSNGYITTGRVTSKEPTKTRINNRRVYKVCFEYTTTDGMTRTGTVKTHQPEKLEDDEKEQLLFNPDDPDSAVMVDSLPKAVKTFFSRL